MLRRCEKEKARGEGLQLPNWMYNGTLCKSQLIVVVYISLKSVNAALLTLFPINFVSLQVWVWKITGMCISNQPFERPLIKKWTQDKKRLVNRLAQVSFT